MKTCVVYGLLALPMLFFLGSASATGAAVFDLSFTPVTLDWQRKACNKIDAELKYAVQDSFGSKGSTLGRPAGKMRAVDDGNSFFRTIAYYVTGTQHDHMKIRQAVVQYMREHMQNEFSEEHFRTMETDGQCATDDAVRATAWLLETPIFVYADNNGLGRFEWIQYAPREDYNFGEPRIYLWSEEKNHFNVVKQVSGLSFKPVTLDWQTNACDRIGAELKYAVQDSFSSTGSTLGRPAGKMRAEDDGNSFFRTIAYYVTGTQHDHMKIRQAVVQYMREHMRDEFNEEYLRTMETDGQFATDDEIRATARLLETPIFVYAEYGGRFKWVQYTSREDSHLVLEDIIPRIYLYCEEKNQFYVVKKVESQTRNIGKRLVIQMAI